MNDILTITLNPALDISTRTRGIVTDQKLRCDSPREDAGGGGVNISRAINFLGGKSKAFIAVGGFAGQRLQSMLASERVDFIPFDCGRETRQNFAITDTDTMHQYRFVMPGAKWSASVIDQALQAINEVLCEGMILTLSGSFPPGVDAGFVTKLHDMSCIKQARLLVDTSGKVLADLVKSPANLDILRMDRGESEMLAGRALNTRVEAAEFAQTLVDSGVAKMVILARGKRGNCLVTKDEKLYGTCPVNSVISAVGAGDSFVAGFALAIAGGARDGDALRLGTVSAGAAVMTEATELCNKTLVDRLLPDYVGQTL